MSWSLMLSPTLLPAARRGVSRETSKAFPRPAAPKRGLAWPGDRCSVGSEPDFLRPVGDALDALLALGVPTRIEGLPMTGA